ncbi:MAG: peptidase U62 [Planctomycetes bacterium]|nr:peptidase U62 [Planctomycetota bacterium]
MTTLAKEVDYSVANLKTADGIKPYYLAYTVTDTTGLSIQSRLGVLQSSDQSRVRALDVDVRVGDYTLDNTRQIRGARGGGGGRGAMGGGAVAISLDNDPTAIRHALWRATNESFNSAVERYQQVVTNSKTMVKVENPADDFSHEQPGVYSEPDVKITVDREAWTARVRAVSAMALKQPKIESSSVSVVGTAENRFMVSNDGTRLKTGRKLLRVVLTASSKAEDGMEISQSYLFNAATEEHLPSEEEMRTAMQKVMDEVLALRAAPLVEPYTGPAILLNRASGVFFHEIFGHRIEGHRQKSEDEGQTFTKMVGQPVLPDFLTVVDDPTLARFGTEDLRGYYKYDDEGVPAQRVTLVKKGVLETFLLSRSPVSGFNKSNGHGRREPGRDAVSRQGNLMVFSDKAVTFTKLREQLVELCKKQGKPFGLLFDDISGGFTTTTRGGPQAFKVQPIVVYRIYADGRPDELVRGVDIVGTPLSCFSRIVATADDTAVFNGTCGAESGWVPVTATSPSILENLVK